MFDRSRDCSLKQLLVKDQIRAPAEGAFEDRADMVPRSWSSMKVKASRSSVNRQLEPKQTEIGQFPFSPSS